MVSRSYAYEGSSCLGHFQSKEEAALCARYWAESNSVSEKHQFKETIPGKFWKMQGDTIEVESVKIWPSFADYKADMDAQLAECKARQEAKN